MLKFLRRFFTENIGLKVTSLILALVFWFYIVNELKRGTEEERQLLQRIMPTQEIAARKLSIKPIFIGKPRSGHNVAGDKVAISPEYCIVVGTRDLLEKIRFAYTMPIDVAGANKAFTKSVPLSPIAPGVYMEDTLVQVTVPVEKTDQ